jgi:flagellar basal body-associated protein FliL
MQRGRLIRVSILCGLVALLLAVSAIFALVRWRQSKNSDTHATIPFRPRVTYESADVLVTNTEAEAYVDTSVNIYVDGTLFRAELGTIKPGETKQLPLSSLTSESGQRFHSGQGRTSELEVRAHFGGYAVHKDFPPPD